MRFNAESGKTTNFLTRNAILEIAFWGDSKEKVHLYEVDFSC